MRKQVAASIGLVLALSLGAGLQGCSKKQDTETTVYSETEETDLEYAPYTEEAIETIPEDRLNEGDRMHSGSRYYSFDEYVSASEEATSLEETEESTEEETEKATEAAITNKDLEIVDTAEFDYYNPVTGEQSTGDTLYFNSIDHLEIYPKIKELGYETELSKNRLVVKVSDGREVHLIKIRDGFVDTSKMDAKSLADLITGNTGFNITGAAIDPSILNVGQGIAMVLRLESADHAESAKVYRGAAGLFVIHYKGNMSYSHLELESYITPLG